MANDSREELRTRLARQGRKIRRIEVIWNASDGGSRMTVTLEDGKGAQLDQWEDWMILGSRKNFGVVIIDQIIKDVLGPDAIEDCAAGFYHRYYTIT